MLLQDGKLTAPEVREFVGRLGYVPSELRSRLALSLGEAAANPTAPPVAAAETKSTPPRVAAAALGGSDNYNNYAAGPAAATGETGLSPQGGASNYSNYTADAVFQTLGQASRQTAVPKQLRFDMDWHAR